MSKAITCHPWLKILHGGLQPPASGQNRRPGSRTKVKVNTMVEWRSSSVESSKHTPYGTIRNGGLSCELYSKRQVRDHG
jgi:hypothetical protein